MTDVAFEILIPKNIEPNGLEFNQPVFELERIQYPQGPPVAFFDHFRLTKSPVPEYIVKALPELLQQVEWQCISIQGIEETSNKLTNESDAPVLLSLLKCIINDSPTWAVIFEPGYDGIQDALSGNIDFVYQKIVESLTLEKPGFIVWKGEV